MDINLLVDEILKEENREQFVLFPLISETNGFANAISFIKNHEEKSKAVVMCETMEKLFPLPVAKEMFENIKIFNSNYFQTVDKEFSKVKKIIVPIFTYSLASSLASLREEGVISTLLCNGLKNKIPIEVAQNQLDDFVFENPNAKQEVNKIKEKLLSLGVNFFSLDFLNKGENNLEEILSPDLEIMINLVEYLGECELEEGVNCTNCTKCKVRGF
jgi:hypothetical protein